MFYVLSDCSAALFLFWSSPTFSGHPDACAHQQHILLSKQCHLCVFTNTTFVDSRKELSLRTPPCQAPVSKLALANMILNFKLKSTSFHKCWQKRKCGMTPLLDPNHLVLPIRSQQTELAVSWSEATARVSFWTGQMVMQRRRQDRSVLAVMAGHKLVARLRWGSLFGWFLLLLGVLT